MSRNSRPGTHPPGGRQETGKKQPVARGDNQNGTRSSPSPGATSGTAAGFDRRPGKSAESCPGLVVAPGDGRNWIKVNPSPRATGIKHRAHPHRHG